MPARPKTAVLITKQMQDACIAPEDLARIAAVTDLTPSAAETWDDEAQLAAIRGAEVAVTGWGVRRITDAMLDAAPGLRLVAHTAGSVKGLHNPRFAERGIAVTSAAAENSGGVGEFAFALMLVAMKAVFQYNDDTRRGVWNQRAQLDWVREPYGAVIGVIGASFAGRRMLELCRMLPFGALLLYDPYVPEDEARALGAEKVELDDLMRRSDAVALHTPITPETHHIVNARNLALLRDRALVINTARGYCLDEQALIAELEKGRLFACLDVTDPEPPVPESPLYTMPNCILMPHIAGSIKENRWRHGKLIADEVERFVRGEALQYLVPLDRLQQLA